MDKTSSSKLQSKTRFKLTTRKTGTYSRNGGIMSSKEYLLGFKRFFHFFLEFAQRVGIQLDPDEQDWFASIWPNTFIDLNGNGRWDPVNRQETAQAASGQARRPPGGGGGGGRAVLGASHLFGRPRGLLGKQFKNASIRKEHDVESGPPNLFRPDNPISPPSSSSSSIRSNGRIPVFHRQSRVELQQGRSQFVRAGGRFLWFQSAI